jgi:hypothetical protein
MVSVKKEQSGFEDGLLDDFSFDDTTQRYQFVKVYNIAFNDSDIFAEFKKRRDVDPALNLQEFISSNVTVSVENTGEVSMMLLLNPHCKNVSVIISMFSQDNKPDRSNKSLVKNFNQDVEFQDSSIKGLTELLEGKCKDLREQV